QADAADRDAVAYMELRRKCWRMDRNVTNAAALLHAEHGAGFLNEAGEHDSKLQLPRRLVILNATEGRVRICCTYRSKPAGSGTQPKPHLPGTQEGVRRVKTI